MERSETPANVAINEQKPRRGGRILAGDGMKRRGGRIKFNLGTQNVRHNLFHTPVKRVYIPLGTTVSDDVPFDSECIAWFCR